MHDSLRLAIDLAEQGRHDEATEILRRAVRANPEDVTAWRWLAHVTRDPDEAVLAVRTILNQRPDDPWAREALPAFEARVRSVKQMESRKRQRQVLRFLALVMASLVIALCGAIGYLGRESRGAAMVLENASQSPTPTETPTDLLPPTETPALPATPTVQNPNGYRLVMYYAEDAFYLWNPGGRTLQLSLIDFEALGDAEGAATNYRFRGSEWVELYPELMPDYCAALELLNFGHYNRPGECARYNVVRTPPPTSEQVFWLPREGISHFRVLWDDQEVARCPVGTGTCEVDIP